MHLHEIDHCAEQHTINQVADGAAQYHPQRQTKQFLLRITPQQPHHPNRCHHGDNNEKHPLPATRIGQQTERCTGVMHAQTPLITTTPYVYEAFDAVYRIDSQKRWLNMMQSAAEHAFIDINDRELSAEATTAGYNPLDGEGNVINASAYRAWLLMSASRQFSRDDYRHAAERNLNYVLQSQQPDGSWFYGELATQRWIDNFHTGYNLRALQSIGRSAVSYKFDS